MYSAKSQSQPKLWTNDPAGLDILAADPPIFFPCIAGRCSGGETFSCKPGYEGVMCASCEKDRFYFQGSCKIACSDIEPQGAVTVFAIIAVMLVWTLINFSAGGLYGSHASAEPLRFQCVCRHLRARRTSLYRCQHSILLLPAMYAPMYHSPLHFGDTARTGLSASMSGFRTSRSWRQSLLLTRSTLITAVTTMSSYKSAERDKQRQPP
jgi:hypothetical protein